MTAEELKLEAQIRAQEYMEQHGITEIENEDGYLPYSINYAYFINEAFLCIHLTRVHCKNANWAECWTKKDHKNYEPQTVHRIYDHESMED